MAAEVQPSSASVPIKTDMPALMAEVTRRSGNYHPSVWGYHFLSYVSEIDPSMEERHEELKEQVRAMIVASASNHSHQLDLIDQVQRLGVSYHFEKEIDFALQHVYDTHDYKHEEDDLYTVALCFRLLRQQGHNISCDVFNKFKETKGKFKCISYFLPTSKKGEFKKIFTNDIRGMMSLYEATHMRVHGEDILDEALEFTTNHLKSTIVHLSKPLAEQVSHALTQPLRKGLERLEARGYISVYQQETSRNELLSKFASLDFNVLQKVHQRELSEITRWWKDLNFIEKLPFARDRMVECYFWIIGVYFEPQYSFARRVQTKIIALTSVLDDIYDLYGTLEELVLFTDAVERWDISVIDQLPEYLKVFYQALLDVYTEMEQVLANEGKAYRIPYAKAAMKKQVRAYFEEAKWYHEGYIPTMEEYMKVALISSGYIMLSTVTLVGMGDEYVNKETFDWVSNEPLIVKASAVIARIMDDMVGHEKEKERGDVASAVDCYMKQHGASKENTFAVLEKLVKNAWKDINQECLGTNAVPMPLLKRFLNLARVIDVLYKDKDAYTDSSKQTKDLVTSVLIDPVPA